MSKDIDVYNMAFFKNGQIFYGQIDPRGAPCPIKVTNLHIEDLKAIKGLCHYYDILVAREIERRGE